MGNTEKSSKPPSAPPEEPRGTIRVDQDDAPGARFDAKIPWWARLLGAALAIAFISLVPNLVGDSAETENEPKPPTVITFPTPLVEEIPPPPTVTSLGIFEWIKLVGDENEIPLGDIYTNPFGEGYVSYSDGSVWLSPDGESWAIVYGATLFRHYSRTTFTGRWALADASDNQLVLDDFRVFQAGDAHWVAVELPDPILPQIKGMSFRSVLSPPVESDSVVLIPFSGSGRVPWENYYGLTSVACGETALCGTAEASGWDSTTETLVVSFFNGYKTSEASLRIEVEANEVAFTDVETDEAIHTLIFEDAGDATSYAQGLVNGFGLEFSGAYVSSNGGEFSLHGTPWPGRVTMLAVPDGGFAAYESFFSQEPGLQMRVWTSRDGISWEDRGTPGFVNGPFDQAELSESGPNLRATLYSGDSINSWLSTDGVAWAEEGPTSLPPWAAIYPTEFGFAGFDFSRDDRFRFWISADGENWEAIQGPTSPPASLVSRPYGAAGDLLFHATPGTAGTRILWVGRLAPS